MAVNKNFVVKNGLEVNTDLILANADTTQVGIATTNPEYTLHVNGGVGATDSYVSAAFYCFKNFQVGLEVLSSVLIQYQELVPLV